jgi:hypothetical protein
MIRLLAVFLFAVGLVAGQDPASRPASTASRPAAPISDAEWNEWMSELAETATKDVFAAAENAVSISLHEARRLVECGAKPIEVKGQQASFLQPVSYVVAGFDPARTVLEVQGGGHRVEYGKGFGVRGVEGLDVSAKGEICAGDAKTGKLDPLAVIGIQKPGSKEIIKIPWDPNPKDRITFVVVKNSDAKAGTMPALAGSLKSRGAKAVVIVDDAGVAATSGGSQMFRRDRYRKPPSEDLPALFVTRDVAKTLGAAAGLPVDIVFDPKKFAADLKDPDKHSDAARSDLHLNVRYRMKDLDIPNVVGQIEGAEASEAVLVSAAAGGSGRPAATLLLAARLLASASPKPRRTVILCLFSGADLPMGGEDWFLTHAAAPAPRFVAAIHLAENEPRKVASHGAIQLLAPTRSSGQDLQAAAGEVMHQAGHESGAPSAGPHAQAALDVFAGRQVPSIAFLPGDASLEDGIALARIVSDLALQMANRPERPALPKR